MSDISADNVAKKERDKRAEKLCEMKEGLGSGKSRLKPPTEAALSKDVSFRGPTFPKTPKELNEAVERVRSALGGGLKPRTAAIVAPLEVKKPPGAEKK